MAETTTTLTVEEKCTSGLTTGERVKLGGKGIGNRTFSGTYDA